MSRSSPPCRIKGIGIVDVEQVVKLSQLLPGLCIGRSVQLEFVFHKCLLMPQESGRQAGSNQDGNQEKRERMAHDDA